MSDGNALAPSASMSTPIFLRTLSGFACQAWIALLALVCLPFFIRLLGMEAFGLIGFYYTLQTVLRMLDLGLTPTVIRELARSTGSYEKATNIVEKASTFESFFAASAAFVAVILFTLSPFLANHWLQNERLSTGTVAVCLALMSVQCGVNWLSTFYQSALLGLERQVSLYSLRAGEATLNSLGALALIIFAGPDIRLVFCWQLVVAAVALCCYWIRYRACLPGQYRGFNFRIDYLVQVRRFAAGMSAITVLGLILTNMDKLFLSRFLTLEQFGNYSLASYVVSTLFGVLITPIFNVMYPRFSSLAAGGDQSLGRMYHLTIQVFAVLTGPLLISMILFTQDFLKVWTQSAHVAYVAAGPIAWLSLGWTLNTLMVGPYILQIASGWTSIGVKLTAMLVVIFAPSLVLLTMRFGLNGAAASYAAMNAAYLVMGLTWTHRRLLPGQLGRVVIADIAPTAIICTLILLVMLSIPLGSLHVWARLGVGALVLSSAFILSGFASARTRAIILSKSQACTSSILNKAGSALFFGRGEM